MLEEGSRDLAKRAYSPPRPYAAHDEPRCCFASRRADDATTFCCRCAHKRSASPLTCLAICFLVLTYNLLGGFLFLALEGNVTAEETAVAASKPNLSQSQSVSNDLRSKTVERLWSITEDLNILYKENWTKLAAKELLEFQRVLVSSMRGRAGGGGGGGGAGGERLAPEHERDYRWTFSTSFLYALTLITTIGHGNVTPKSCAGRLVAVAYACVGIPIIMLYLSTLGEALARGVRGLYARLRPPARLHARDRDKCDTQRRTPFQAALNLDSFSGGYHWTCRDHTRVPIILSLLLIVLYIALGTFVFHTTERWNLVDGCYFSFASLATIGFGDLRPGLYASTISAKAEDIAVGVCCIYILVGIVVIAMCFNLIQEDLGALVRGATTLCAGASKSRAVHSADAVCDEKISMSVVS
ncbi:hypothetical protein PYW08_008496 [Mythimna loreyi]|uniref:Uncharacterized protein n=1 Tax=Mythimna loreyi TaxID=667449 RepID=A0ACC2QC18_9NEOP|nr:hypothetical protein PYW08_008496 [Mythimna loreyi]